VSAKSVLVELGRFIQTDPIGLQTEGAKLSAQQAALYITGGAPETFSFFELNLYRYCNNDPINNGDPYGLDPTALKWSGDAAKIKLEPAGNWGDRTSPGYYEDGLTRAGEAVEGKTNLGLTDLKANPDGGVTGNLLVDTHVLPGHKRDLMDTREQDHPNLAKEFLKNVSDDALRLLVNDDRAYNSMKDYAEGRKEYVQKLYDAMVTQQNLLDRPRGSHDHNRPEFHR